MKRFFLSLFILVALSAVIVYTQDYSFGNITVNGISPVVASSPGAGIAHFAGATQTVTSSAVALASDVSGQLPISAVGSAGLSGTSPVTISAAGAIGCATCNTGSGPALTFFQTTVLSADALVLSAGAVNHIRLAGLWVPQPITFSTIAYVVQTADNTAHTYDIGAYGPGCFAGTASIALAFHSGSLAGTTLFPSTGRKTVAATGGPITIQPGWYCVAITSATGNTAILGGDGGSLYYHPFAAATDLTGGGATLPGTITAPATSFALGTQVEVGLW